MVKYMMPIGMIALCLAGARGAAAAETGAAASPSMAPLAQYLSPSRADEITLTRSAAPPAISQDAEILVLTPKGYESATKGKNGFVCIVVRSWANNFDNADFWNPKLRAPHCFNAAAARSVLPTYLKRTAWALSGVSQVGML